MRLFMCVCAFILGFFPVDAQRVSLEQVFKTFTYVPENYEDAVFLKDNSTFARVKNNAIVRYRNLTGDSLGIIVDFKRFDALKPLKITGFSTDSSNSVFLLESRIKGRYRRSYTARYFLYHVGSDTIMRLSDSARPTERASLSPGGTEVAYVRDNNMYLNSGGKEIQVTSDGVPGKIINGVGDWIHEEEFDVIRTFEWSPSGRYIAWIRYDESLVPPWTISRYDSVYPSTFTYKYPKVSFPVASASVKIYDIKRKKTVEVPLPANAVYVPKVDWSPDGMSLAITSLNRAQNELHVHSYSLAHSRVSVIYHEKSATYVQYPNYFTWLKDGRSFVVVRAHQGNIRLCRFTLGDSVTKVLSPFNQDVVQLCAYDSHHDCLYYELADDNALNTKIYRVASDGSSSGFLTPEAGVCNSITFSPDYSNFLYTIKNASQNVAVYGVDYQKSLKSELYNNAALQDTCASRGCVAKVFGTVEIDSFKLNYSVMKPRDFDSTKKYPVVFCVYGGPGIPPEVINGFNYNYYWQQYLLGHGLVVVSVDPRGTPWRGLAFRDATWGALGTKQLHDILATFDHLKLQSWFDSTRVGIEGWSFGGTMVLQCLARSSRFKCGVAIAPVTDWKFYDCAYTERYMGTPAANPAGYASTSLLDVASRISGSLLLAHGLADDNVHAQNTLELVKRLNAANIHYKLLMYPDKNHNIGGTRLHLFEEVCKFLIESLK